MTTRLLYLFLLLPVYLHAQDSFYTRHWSRVYRYELKALPHSAASVVDTIYAQAKKDNDIPQLVKALIYHAKFAGTAQGGARDTLILALQRELVSARPPLQNILQGMLAKLYHQYYTDNKWRLNHQRREGRVIDGLDYTTWDGAMFLKMIDDAYQRTLVNPAVLQQIDLASIKEILEYQSTTAHLRPTLYDFLAHQAVDFYADATTGYEQYEDYEEEVSVVQENYFGLKISPIDHYTGMGQILFDVLLAYRERAQDTTGCVVLELERLQFLIQAGMLTAADRLERLKTLRDTYARHKAVAFIDAARAELLLAQDARVTDMGAARREALALCEGVLKDLPESEVAEQCRSLRHNILRPILRVQAETFIPVQTPSRLRVEYTNIDTVSLDIYSVSEKLLPPWDYRTDDVHRLEEIRRLPKLAGSIVALRSLGDYGGHSTELVVPALRPGMYLLLVCNATGKEDAVFAQEVIRVTNVAMLETSLATEARYQIIDRQNGAPMAGVDIQAFDQRGPASSRCFVTDGQGFFSWAKDSVDRFVTVVATAGSDQMVFDNHPVHDVEDVEELTARAVVFTDRSLYRPGQTVYFKGMVVQTRGTRNAVVEGQGVKVSLEDANGKDIGVRRLTTNAFGSFSGEFILPATGLTGAFTVSVDEDFSAAYDDELDDFTLGEQSIAVEEYKRPTFEASFQPVSRSYQAYDSVTVTGTARALAGAHITGAKVAYRVQRVPSRYTGRGRLREHVMATGTTTTDVAGNFAIRFKAWPEPADAQDEQAIFQYTVSADITDLHGETRSASMLVQAGCRTLTLALEAPYRITINDTAATIQVRTENLNMQFTPARGTWRLYKIRSPAAPFRKRVWEAPDLPVISEQEFQALFPYEPYTDIEEYTAGQNGVPVRAGTWNTGNHTTLTIPIDATWQTGEYRLEVTGYDAGGQLATAKHIFELLNPDAKTVADSRLLTVDLKRRTADTVVLHVGTAAENLAVTIAVESGRKVVTTYVVRLAGEVKEIVIPVTESLRHGFRIRVSSAAYNMVLSRELEVGSIIPEPALTIHTTTFRDKTGPGFPQTWRFRIEGPDAQRAEAEVLASMYDASLDAFKPHAWALTLPYRAPDETRNSVKNHGFGVDYFRIGNAVSTRFRQRLYFTSWDWFNVAGYDGRLQRRYLRRIALSAKAPVRPFRIRRSHDRSLPPGTIAGVVMDEHGTPLDDVLVIATPGTKLLRTNSQGHYRIAAGKNDTLLYRGIGRTPTYIRVKRKNRIRIYLAEDDADLVLLNQLSLVTTATQKVANQSLVSAQSNLYYLGNDDNPLQELLQGVQGVSVGVEHQGTIRIRGANSLRTAANLPLYIVDGVPVASFQVDAPDISTIEVLRDADATAIYGARGASGVVIITTKGGNAKLDDALAKVPVRKNFQETAFFFPHLSTDSVGRVQFSFTMPEALTRWKLQLLAHDRQWRTAIKTLQTVTQQALMATANPPRFLRAGDVIRFPVKVTNLADHAVEGDVMLQLTDAVTGKVVDSAFAPTYMRRQPFVVGAGGNAEVSFTLKVPAGIEAVQYKIFAWADNNSDGEQNVIPVLSNRVLVTEAIPVTVRPGQTQTVSLDAWKAASATREDRRVVVEATSNPVWYAVQALPYLLEFPYECAEQTFARYYANTLATHLANRHPKIRAVLDAWRATGAPSNALEKNAALKSILLEETPWARDAESEAEQHQRLALLFDSTRQQETTTLVADKLRSLQLSSGAFPWFGGGAPSRVITQHIVSAYGHLRKLQALPQPEAVLLPLMRKALVYLDDQVVMDHARCLAAEQRYDAAEPELLTHEQLQYLYLRSFFPDIAPNKKTTEASDYFLRLIGSRWQTADLYAQGQTALVLYRHGKTALAKDVLRSLEERSIQSDETGMYWSANTAGYTWYQAPMEVQALLIEAFAEIGGPAATPRVDALRNWLLRERRATQWKTTKATTEALYALLLPGSDWLSTTSTVAITVGDRKLIPDAAQQQEAATGYYKASWEGAEATTAMADVTFTQHGTSPAWAAVYRQYLEDVDKVVSTGTALTIRKQVYRVDRTISGEKLTAVSALTSLHVGDLLRVRLEVQAGRAVEFIHVKDSRAAGLEPVDVLSKHRLQGGVVYYQSTKDASTNFFFDVLPVGTHILEYDARVNNTGDFASGIATIQSMYAPEFTAHSSGGRLRVK